MVKRLFDASLRACVGACLTVCLSVSIATCSGAAVVLAAAAPASVSQVKIALIDTGVRTDRLPQSGNIEAGRNYVIEGGDTEDVVGHGTRIAGLILGVAPEATLVPLVYYTKYPSGVSRNGGVEAICTAIYDAIDAYGCRILNLGSGVRNDDPGLRAAVEYAEEMGAIVIAAVGNDRVAAPDDLFYPASYKTAIGVGAVTQNLESAPFSQQNGGVTVVAPGTDLEVLSIQEGAATEVVSGTSYATSYISAYAFTYLSAYPDVTPAEFREHLAQAALDLGDPGYDDTYGWGYIGPETGITDPEAESDASRRFRNIQTMGFSDVAPTDWYADSVFCVWEARLMLGVSGDSFGPAQYVTWEMLDTLLGRYYLTHQTCQAFQADQTYQETYQAHLTDRTDQTCQADRTDQTYQTDRICQTDQTDQTRQTDQTCVEALPPLILGLIRSQNASALVTREEFCVVVACHLGLLDSSPAVAEPAFFLDIDDVEGWARDYVLAAGAADLFRGDDLGRFRPKDAITRAEVAAVLSRLLSGEG